jgi:replicative DNA helicase
MDLYFALLKALLDYNLFSQYESAIDQRNLKENYPEIFRLFQCLKYLHRDGTEKVFDSVDLLLALKVLYPASNENDYTPLVNKIKDSSPDPDEIVSYLRSIKDRQEALKVAEAAVEFSQGRVSKETYLESLSKIVMEDDSGEAEKDLFVTTDLDELIERTHGTPGLRWRLDSLNKRLGSLRKGDFGFLFARPETGKTTFLASEISFMASQTEQPIIWFNNEEQGEKVNYRVYQSTLGLTPIELERDRESNKRKFKELMGDRWRLVDDAGITAKRIEHVCKIYQPALIIIDQIDKIRGFSDDRNDLELTAIYSWGRELAKQFAPVIGVSQAGNSAEGKRWLTMSDVNGSKTGKQGEADWILGIGKDSDVGLETYRYLYLSKNKLSGDSDTNPALRHDRWEVKIQPDIARYTDL